MNFVVILFTGLGCFALQPSSPIRCEIDIKLGGTQCNLIVSRFIPWMQLRSSKSKKMVLRDEGSSVEKQRLSEQNAIMWNCTASAPEMTIVLYNLSDMPVYHVSIFFWEVFLLFH